MKTVHLFYNGNEAIFPPDNAWEDFAGHDSVRLFLTCAESWRRQDWNVVRLTTTPKYSEPVQTGPGSTQVLHSFDYVPQVFSGRIATEGKWFPALNWQLIAKCCSLKPDPDGEIWIGSFDVFNWGFRPAHAFDVFHLYDHHKSGCVSFQREHFSMALFCATPEWFQRARKILRLYDDRVSPRIPGKYTSDETILRTYGRYALNPAQSFPHSPQAASFPLTHYARSTLKAAYETVPTV